MQEVYKGLQSWFLSLAWPWLGRSLPQGEPVGELGPWTWAQCGQAPVLPLPTMWPTQSWQIDIFALGWLAGQLQLVGWLMGYLTKCQPDPPQAETSGAKCVTTLVRLTTPWGRDILWPSVILWHYLTFGSGWPSVRGTPKPETSCGQVWYDFRSGRPVYLRVSLVPAAMVIPVSLAYIKVVAVKKLIFICWDD